MRKREIKDSQIVLQYLAMSILEVNKVISLQSLRKKIAREINADMKTNTSIAVLLYRFCYIMSQQGLLKRISKHAFQMIVDASRCIEFINSRLYSKYRVRWDLGKKEWTEIFF